ncbi:hypothetical protein DL1_08510 [Thioclava dalianensis]|uniref:Uncharacterized protein n=1 Tax=Thioclava dalianensis TaxID=1185766 RepID=A0A074U2F3_9RHOB|nr:hypothetical protein [Thioclava dalianensis]KEP68817.1 hypothetical protein DL1_08510 [Thioclava dalianensis]SFN50044.1 hypothetical protein SAMN05216224_10685 [Thioclava dalianensis]
MTNQTEERDKILPHPITIRETSNGGFIVGGIQDIRCEPVDEQAYSDPVDLFHALMQRFGMSKHDLFPEREGEPQSPHLSREDLAAYTGQSECAGHVSSDQWSKDEMQVDAGFIFSDIKTNIASVSLNDFRAVGADKGQSDRKYDAGDDTDTTGVKIRLRRCSPGQEISLEVNEEVTNSVFQDGTLLIMTTQT